MIDWWSETDDAIVECLRASGPMSPEDLARRVGLSVGETGAFLAMLMREDRVRVRIVEVGSSCDATRSARLDAKQERPRKEERPCRPPTMS